MKLIGVLGLLSICSVASLAQSASDVDKAPSLIVTKHNHTVKFQEYISYSRPSLPEPRRDTSSRPTIDSDNHIGLYSMEEARPVTKSRILFLYSAKVKNVGAKKIEAVVWDYVFVRAADDNELGRFRILSRSSIGPDKSKLLSAQTLKHPPLKEVLGVVNVKDLEKKDVPLYSEKVEIKCIVYADGTWWRHSTMTDRDCGSLIKDQQRKDR